MAKKKPKFGVPSVEGFSFVGEPQPYGGAEIFAPEAVDERALPQERTGLIRRVIGDGGIALMKGAVAVPEAAVGLFDIVTGGAAGKFLENEGGAVGFRPKEAKAALDTMLSPEQQKANQAVQEAQGFLDTTLAALKNPSVIFSAAAEAVPSMLGGGVVARTLLKMAPAAGVGGRIAAGAAGEGVVAAGAQAEGIRQETADGRLTGTQSLVAAASGLATGVLGLLGGAVARKLGIADIDTILAGKGSPEVTKGFLRRVLEGAIAEGGLEELPQSVQEQVAQNYALGRPLGEGVAQAAVLGALTGGLMGAGGNAMSTAGAVRQQKPAVEGPATRAAAARLEAVAQQLDAMPAAVPGAVEQPQSDVSRGQEPPAEPMPEAVAPPPVLPFAPDAAAIAQREADRPPEPTEQAAEGEKVFKTMRAAMRAQAQTPGAELVPVAGGLVVRAPAAVQPPSNSLSSDATAVAPPASAAPELPGVEAAPPAPPDPDPRPDDTLAPTGQPWPERSMAVRTMKQKGDGFTIAKVNGGFAVRKLAAVAAPVDEAAHAAATSPTNDLPEPTQAQKEAGNYSLGHHKLAGLDLSIENPAGSKRRGVDRDGKAWENTLQHHYGYVKGSLGADGDHVDAFVKPGTADEWQGTVFVVDQVHPDTGKFDEHKALLGFDTEEEAREAYAANYAKDWKGLKAITAMPAAEFRAWATSDEPKKGALAKTEGVTDVPQTGDDPGAAAGPVAPAGGDRADSQAPAAVDDGTAFLKSRGFQDTGPAPGEWTIPVSGLGDVIAKVVSKSGEPVRLEISADFMGKRLDTRIAEGEAAIDEAIERARTGLNQGRERMARDAIAKERGLEAPAAAPALPAPQKPAAPATPPEDSPEARWTRMPTVEREAVLIGAGWHSGSASTQTMRAKAWPTMTPSQKGRLTAAMDANEVRSQSEGSAGASPNPAPKPPIGERQGDATPKRASAAQRAADGRIAALKSYFTPGNILKGYGGFDEVLALKITDDGSFSVNVHHVTKSQGSGQWVRIGKPQDARWHSTFPDARELKAGPVAGPLTHMAGELVSYTEGRADGQPFENAPDRGTAPPAAAPAPVVSDKQLAAFNDARKAVSEKSFGEPPAAPPVSANTVFTDEAAAAARAILKRKLGIITSGIDPEILQAGMTLAGYHIEKGARTFAAYAKAMLDDLGDAVKPYLKSWYMGVKYDPRASGWDGLDVSAVVEAADVGTGPASPAPVAQNQSPEAQNAADAAPALDRPGEGPLAGVPTQEVRGTDGQRPAGERPAAGGAVDGAGDVNADRSGNTGGRSVRAGARAKPVSGARSRRGGGTDADGGLFGSEAVPEGSTGLQRPVDPPEFARKDFRITDETRLGEGGQKTKFKQNVSAIRLVNELEASGRPATVDEQNVLARYVGWGGLAQAFDAANADWSKEHAELKALLTPDEYAAALESTQYAHYTSEQIVGGIYSALQRLGFTGGKILEPGGGVGNFIGLMPDGLKTGSRFTLVERERISARIAKHLYPQQNVQLDDFTAIKGNDDFFDLATGNPPFASTPLTDVSGRKHLSGLSVHNYFFAKAVDMLRPGGILAQVVSNSFMDAGRDRARKYIGERARLLGAIRLPNNAFSKNANTEVTTDLIFLQKLPEAEWGTRATKEAANGWMDQASILDPAGGADIAINRYFQEHPEMMLGQMGRKGTMYGPDQPALVARPGQDTAALLAAAIERLPANVYVASAVAGTEQMQGNLMRRMSDTGVEVGGFFERDGRLYQRGEDEAGESLAQELTPESPWTEKTKLGQARFDRIKELAGLRVTVRALIATEMAGNKLQPALLRETLNNQYDAYVKAHGYINDQSAIQAFGDDPDYPLLASLEQDYKRGMGPEAARKQGIKPFKSSAKKAAMFTRSVVAARKAVARAETPADALAVSMAERGRIDPAYMADLLGKDADAILADLATGNRPHLFKDPASGEYVLRDAYLSGNVRKKLEQARAAGMMANVHALEEVLPADVGVHEITVRAGSPWVPTDVFEDFAKHLLGEGTTARIGYLPMTSGFMVSIKPGNDVAETVTYGTGHVGASKIFEALLNNATIKVTYTDSEGKTHTNKEATEAANLKAGEMRDKFADWIFADPDRAEVLARAYNDTNNNYVTRVYDGSLMTFPGKVPDEVIRFRRHQRNAIARIVQDRTVLLDHVVGAGKTFTVIAGAMELKRTGLAKKPMIVVPNHLVKQWAADFYRLYPGANILAATKKDFQGPNRRRFLARIATGDWDAVILAHSSFGFIAPAPEFEQAFNQRQVADIMATIAAVEANGDEKDPKTKRRVKQLAKMKEGLEQRIKSLRDRPIDSLLDFGQLGVDQLFVDEAHMFKNLMFSSKMQNVSGLGDGTGSQRAYDMYVKTQQVMEANGRGQGVGFATGTPISNSLAEMYHMQRYLMPAAMLEGGFQSFDAWANTFASVDQIWMQKISGDGFKVQNRMGTFVNTPELLKLFDQVADTVTMEDIKKAYAEENNGAEFPLPKLKTGRRQPVSLAKSAAQEAYMIYIAKRAKLLELRKGPPQKGDDNHLSVMGDARKAAMDIRLVDFEITEREPGGRIDRSSDEVVTRYRKYDSVKGTQIVFSDLGTPIKHAKAELKEYEALMARADKLIDEDLNASAALGDKAAAAALEDAQEAADEMEAKGSDWLDAVKAALRGFSVYDDFKAALIEKGIPEHEIAFIHDYNTDDQKAALFRKVNAGQIRVLMGSTAKLGAGTNVQERLVAEHHLDVPWKPSDVEQREGRIIRQGNRLMDEVPDFEIEILAYVTRDTLDMRMWQIQEAKLRMINQLRERKIGREVDNAFQDMEMSAGEMQAAATGNMDLLKEIQLKNDVKVLEQKKRAFDAQRADLATRRKNAQRTLDQTPRRIAELEPWAAAGEAYSEAQQQERAVDVTVDGKRFTTRSAAADALRAIVDAHEARLDERKAIIKGNGGISSIERPETEARAAAVEKAGDKDEAARLRKMLADFKEVPPMPKLAVEFNGETYGSKAAVAAAFTAATGDAARIDWTTPAGKKLIHREAIVDELQGVVRQALDTDTPRSIGSFGPFQIAVEGQRDRLNNALLDVQVTFEGRTRSDTIAASAKDTDTASNAVHLAQRIVNRASNDLHFARHDLARAQKAMLDLNASARAEDNAAWSGEAQLEKARKDHREVLARLAAPVAAAPDAGAPDASLKRGAGAGVDLASAQAMADKLVAAGAVKINVVRSVDDLPPMPKRWVSAKAPNGRVRGAYLPATDQVWLFTDQLKDADEFVHVALHEAFHRGLAKTIPGAKPLLRQMHLANAALREATASQMQQHGIGLDEAIEEALADMAGSGAARDLSGWQKLIDLIRSWLSKIASAAGVTINWTDDMVADFVAGIRREGLRAGAHVNLGDAALSRVEDDGIIVKKLPGPSGAMWAVVRKGRNGDEHLGYHASEREANEQAASLRLDTNRAAGAGVHWWVDGSAEPIQSTPLGRLDSLARQRAVSQTLNARSGAVKTRAEGLNLQQDPKRAGFCFKCAADAAIHDIGDMVIGIAPTPQGPDWHAVVMRDGMVYDPTFARWFAPGVYEALGFDPKLTLTPAEVRAFSRRTRGLVPDARNQGLVDGGPKLSRSLAGAVDSVRDLHLPMNYRLGDFFNSDGRISWWHRSVGTMHNLAARSPMFRRVYDAVQSFIADVSFYASEAADLAPRILPKLEQWRDVWKSPLKPEEAKAIAAPIFEGTLVWARDAGGKPIQVAELEAQAAAMSVHEKAQAMLRRQIIDPKVLRMWQGLPVKQYEAAIESRYASEALKPGVVWSDKELKGLFGLTEGEGGTIALYREFRKATDRSITNLAISDMVRYGGDDVAPVRRKALAANDIEAAALILRDHLFEMAEADEDRAKVLNDTGNRMMLKADKAKDLIARGYAPLSRFGQYSLDVVDADGERVYFGLFESTSERARMARNMRAQFPDASISTGTVSQEAHKLFAGVSPETLELFGEMLGLEAQGDDASSKAFQTYLKVAKSTRSAMKRLIQRKGIAGFSEDAGRVLAGFITSNARQTASNLHMGEMTDAAAAIPKGDGQLQDAAVKLVDYVRNPQEEAQAIRGWLFAQYLGGSIASAAVNMTQPATVTLPYLSQFGGAAKAAARVGSAARLAWKKAIGDDALDKALRRAEERGIVAPQEVHQLQAQAMGRATLKSGDGTKLGNLYAGGMNRLSVLGFAWGKVFGMAEQTNRRITFIAAYRTAVAEKIANPEAFAEKAVNETQFVYNKGNKPRWARGAVGSIAFTFKQYSISYLELMNRMWNAGAEGSPERAAGRKAVLLALAVLMLAGGADGLPFAQDLDDLIDGFLQRLGYNFSTKQARREFLVGILGEGGAQFVSKGLSGLPGVPIDVSGRMGMGNLIPGTGLVVKKTDHTRDVAEFAGPAADLVKRGFEAAGQLVDGDPKEALTTIAPVAARNWVKSFDMAATGLYRDDRGRKVLDVDGYDAAVKFLGFQPNDVARVQEATGTVQRMIAQTKLRETEIADQWALGMFEGDQAKVQEARDELKRWNESNPSSRIRIDMPQVRKRVIAMRQSKARRIAKTAPKEIRAEVRRELAATQ